VTSKLHVLVTRKTVEAQGICSFDLVAADGSALPAFDAGAHIDVHLGDGLVRQYSLCNNPSERHRYRLAVLLERASRGGSVAMHALTEGQPLTISTPRNHFRLASGARRHLLLAGGIGITPILSMAEHLAAQGAEFDLHYCTRSTDRTAFAQHLQDSPFAGKVRFHHSEASTARKLDPAAVVAAPGPQDHLYVCGPGGFIEAVLAAARAAGWAGDHLHREFFAASPADAAQDGAFEIVVASTGAAIRVAPRQTAIEALATAGIQVPMSCEQGVCGTCLTRVLEGTPDHRDVYLTDQEHARGDCFTPCCSRAKSPRLVLDL
jgi:vanillate O-demethylase ferredoxin subunit